ncbi:hypothetical protein C0991_004205 [Blastosporella zonata]|nr:hypothetical protein C0991_004205 [Blastosporella zonata]
MNLLDRFSGTKYFQEYVAYLREYCDHFALWPRIKLQTKVVNILRNPSGGHTISYVSRNSELENAWSTVPTLVKAEYVVVCTGLHVIPSVPTIPGAEYFSMQDESEGPSALHSHRYKSRSQLQGKRIMILGTGETGMDIAYEAVQAGATEVTLCSRSGFLSFPKALNDFEILGFKFESKKPVPIDSLITNLGETAYVIGELDPSRLGRAYVFLNKSHKAMPYINRPYRNRPKFLDYLSRYIDPPEDSPPQTNFVVDLAPFPTSFSKEGRAVFPISHRKDAIRMANRIVKPELVVFATGYTQSFDFLDKESGYATPADADMRDVTKTGDESVAFIGFVRPGVGMMHEPQVKFWNIDEIWLGAIPPLAEMQIFFWISVIKGQVIMPLTAPHYHLLVKDTARIKYGVDHSAYMSTLAKDIGASPGLWELWLEYDTHILISPISLSFPQPVTALSFDPISDVLWAGSSAGDVTGYYGTRGIRGVSYKVGGTLPVKKVVAGENHVRALGVEGFGTWAKGGMNKWYFRCD